MISRSGKENFFVTHYDWLVAAVGVAALVAGGVFFVFALGEDAENAAEIAVASVNRLKPAKVGVEPTDRGPFNSATRLVRSPVLLADVAEKQANFLASERRVKCKCGKAIPGDVKAFPKCPYCGVAQEAEKVIVLDADKDGLPDEWERKHGLNPQDPADGEADADKDGFSNLEEYEAKTDPRDPKDHPDYLDSLRVTLPLKETYMPFVFTKATQIPAGWRCEFFDASQKDNYGRSGRTLTAMIGEEIGKNEKAASGYVLKAYDKKEEKRERKGMKGMFVAVDVSVATVERTSDGKSIQLVVSAKKAKPAPVDVQASLVYERMGSKTFEVVPGSKIELNGTGYRILSVKAVGKGAEVVVEHVVSGKKRTLKALE